MGVSVDDTALTEISIGYTLLGSGGGGSTALLESVVRENVSFPIMVADLDDVDPDALCLGAAFVGGGAVLMAERLPGSHPFDHLISSVEQWLGESIGVVCSLEGGGLNALVPLLLSDGRVLVDADLTGRAVASHEQMSIVVDALPHVVAACDLGAGGVVVADAARAEDIDSLAKFAAGRAGGVGGIVFAGFRVRDLHEHSIIGHLARARALGSAFRSAVEDTPERLAAAIGAEHLCSGKIAAVRTAETDGRVRIAEITGEDEQIIRLIGATEYSAVVIDGQNRAASPSVIVVVDADSHQVIPLEQIGRGPEVDVFALPAASWWRSSAHRLRFVLPSFSGLADLDEPR